MRKVPNMCGNNNVKFLTLILIRGWTDLMSFDKYKIITPSPTRSLLLCDLYEEPTY